MGDRSLPPILPAGTRVVARVAVRVVGGGRELPARPALHDLLVRLRLEGPGPARTP